jgi:putative transcriptional regulator
MDPELTGTLLMTLPNTLHKEYARTVMVVAGNWPMGSECIIVNRPMQGTSVQQVMRHAGIDYLGDEPIYWGGDQDRPRIQILHTLDWNTSNTRYVNDHLGLSNEIGILAAIAGGQGPRHWRCISGRYMQDPGELEAELNNIGPYADPRWGFLKAPASPELVFTGQGDEQWLHCIDAAANLEVASWF